MAIGLTPKLDTLNEDGFPFDKEGNAIFTDTVAVSRGRQIDKVPGK